MRGKHRVIVSTKRLKYDFELRRNLTIIRGDSATGKTTLVDMIQEYVNNPTGSPVDLICDKNVMCWKALCGKDSWRRLLTVSYLLMRDMILLRPRSLPEKFRKQIIIM